MKKAITTGAIILFVIFLVYSFIFNRILLIIPLVLLTIRFLFYLIPIFWDEGKYFHIFLLIVFAGGLITGSIAMLSRYA